MRSLRDSSECREEMLISQTKACRQVHCVAILAKWTEVKLLSARVSLRKVGRGRGRGVYYLDSFGSQ